LSRGLIIPQLLPSRDATQAVANARQQINPADYAPFRLLILDGKVSATITSDSDRLVVAQDLWQKTPLMLTSSSLGDTIVEAVRRPLFEEIVVGANANRHQQVRAQDAFHAHQWPGRASVSVLMSRSDARTVSHTTIEAVESSVTMEYRDLSTGDASAVDGLVTQNAGRAKWRLSASPA
jgi:hypothetical protein